MKTEKILLTKLNADTHNANKHNQKNLDAIRSNIEEFGVYAPLVVRESTMTVIVGNGRLETLRAMGREYADCILMTLTDAKSKKLAIADNRSSELSEWDDVILAELLTEIGEDEAHDIGFTAEDLADILPDSESSGGAGEDEAPGPPAEPIAKLGDIYELGNHRLICGDSTDKRTVEKLMNGEKADMVFTDPPYGINYQSNHRVKTERFDKLKNDNKFITGWLPLVDEFSTGFVFVWTSWGVVEQWIEHTKVIGVLSNLIIWAKRAGGMGDLKKTFCTDFEIALVFNRGASLTGKRIGSIWDIMRDHTPEYLHPTQKPVELSSTAILHTTKKNDLVLDFFGGSGSTLIACEKTDRRCRMMELDPAYCDVIVNRYCKLKGIDAEKVFKSGTTE